MSTDKKTFPKVKAIIKIKPQSGHSVETLASKLAETFPKATISVKNRIIEFVIRAEFISDLLTKIQKIHGVEEALYSTA